MNARLLVLALAPAVLGACGSTPADTPETPEILDVQRPWPQTFMDAGLLVADDVRIEGPRGLVDHVALSQDDALFHYEVETLPEGFRQRLTKKSEVEYAELKAALDNLTITAFQRVTVLERPGDVPVRLVARGNVWYHGTATPNLVADGLQAEGALDWRGAELVLSSR